MLSLTNLVKLFDKAVAYKTYVSAIYVYGDFHYRFNDDTPDMYTDMDNGDVVEVNWFYRTHTGGIMPSTTIRYNDIKAHGYFSEGFRCYNMEPY